MGSNFLEAGEMENLFPSFSLYKSLNNLYVQQEHLLISVCTVYNSYQDHLLAQNTESSSAQAK